MNQLKNIVESTNKENIQLLDIVHEKYKEVQCRSAFTVKNLVISESSAFDAGLMNLLLTENLLELDLRDTKALLGDVQGVVEALDDDMNKFDIQDRYETLRREVAGYKANYKKIADHIAELKTQISKLQSTKDDMEQTLLDKNKELSRVGSAFKRAGGIKDVKFSPDNRIGNVMKIDPSEWKVSTPADKTEKASGFMDKIKGLFR
jgi:chromosome segregation ATPase